MNPLLSAIRLVVCGTDRALLAAYVTRKDEEAFAELVHRHAGMVRRAAVDVCPTEADDITQAAFVLLAQRANELTGRESAAGWLFETTRRLAFKARTAASRRARRESTIAIARSTPGPLDELTFGEIRTIVGEELAKLPDRLRLPLVLCYWEGATLAVAANRLGCSASAIKRRLSTGRDQLAARLARRGFTGVGVLTALTALEAAAQASTPVGFVATRTVGQFGMMEPVSPRATALLRETSGTISGLKLFTAPAVLLAVGLGLAFGLGTPSKTAPPISSHLKPVRNAEHSSPQTDALGDPLPPNAITRMGTIRWRFRGAPRGIVLSPTGKFVAVSGFRRIGIFDLDSGKQMCEIPQERGLAFQFTSDGSRLMIRGERGIVWFYDPATGQPLGETKPVVEKDATVEEGRRRSIASHVLTGDGRWIITAQPTPTGHLLTMTEVAAASTGNRQQRQLEVPAEVGKSIDVYQYFCDGKVLGGAGRETSRDRKRLVMFWWNATTGKLSKTTPIDVAENGFRLSSDGKRLVTWLDGFRVWDTRTGAEAVKLEGPVGTGYAPQFSPDGKRLVGTVYDPTDEVMGTATVWELERGKVISRVRLPQKYSQPFLLADGRRLLAADYGLMLTTWDITTGRRINPLSGHEGALRHMVFSADGRTLYTASYATTERVVAWDSASGKQLRELTASSGYSRFVLTPGNAIVTATYEGAFIWNDVTTGRELRRINPRSFDKDLGGEIWGAEVFGSRDPRTGRPVVFGVIPARNRKKTLIASWDAESGESLARRLLDDGQSDSQVVISPNGRFLAREIIDRPAGVSLADATNCMAIVLEDALTGNRLLRINQPDCLQGKSICFTPDGQSLISWTTMYPEGRNQRAPAGTTTVRLWELRSGKQRLAFTLPVLKGLWTDEPEAIAVSPDGRFFAAARPNKIISVWELATGKEIAKRSGYSMRVSCLAFRPDGRALASGHEDGTAIVWDFPQLPIPKTAVMSHEVAWRDLAGGADKAHHAILSLATDPKSVEFLQARVKPATPVPASEVQKLIADLGNAEFAIRERATASLAKFGDSASVHLQASLKSDLSPEQRRRVVELLKGRGLAERDPGQLRALRSIEVLGRIGNTQAVTILRELAKGASGARLTQEAADALKRLGK